MILVGCSPLAGGGGILRGQHQRGCRTVVELEGVIRRRWLQFGNGWSDWMLLKFNRVIGF